MKTLTAMLAAAAMVLSCGRTATHKETFTIETVNKITPVKDQGRSSLCWLYAMLATIESDRLAEGDSVNLSPDYVARAMLAEMAERRYLSEGSSGMATDGMAPQALAALAEYGAMPYDAYRTECNYNVLERKLEAVADLCARKRTGMAKLRQAVGDMLDDEANPVPSHVWMYGMEYTPLQFAGSVYTPSSYIAMTSYTHEPFYRDIVLDLPANRYRARFYNVPIDTLAGRVEQALRSGRSVCWEGDTSNGGFSFERGVARLADESAAVGQADRQRALERFDVTDDHCMELIGMARDSRGRRYFVCKNSWGTGNPYKGLMFMSSGYFRLNTIAVVMKKGV